MDDQLLKKFKIQNTSVFLFALVILIGVIALTIIVSGGSTSNILFFFMSLLVMYSIVFVIILIKAITKSSEILFYSKSITVRGKSIELEDIDVIMKSGNLYGIKPKYSEIVPASFSFRFSDSQEDGGQYLQSWAEENKIGFVNRGFVRLI